MRFEKITTYLFLTYHLVLAFYLYLKMHFVVLKFF